jgi:hypothetical protein
MLSSVLALGLLVGAAPFEAQSAPAGVAGKTVGAGGKKHGKKHGKKKGKKHGKKGHKKGTNKSAKKVAKSA